MLTEADKKEYLRAVLSGNVFAKAYDYMPNKSVVFRDLKVSEESMVNWIIAENNSLGLDADKGKIDPRTPEDIRLICQITALNSQEVRFKGSNALDMIQRHRELFGNMCSTELSAIYHQFAIFLGELDEIVKAGGDPNFWKGVGLD